MNLKVFQKFLTGLLVGMMMLFTTAAQAGTVGVGDYPCAFSGVGVSGTCEIFTFGDQGTFAPVTAITGSITVGSTTGTISGVFPTGFNPFGVYDNLFGAFGGGYFLNGLEFTAEGFGPGTSVFEFDQVGAQVLLSSLSAVVPDNTPIDFTIVDPAGNHVPEPSSLALSLLAFGLIFRRRRIATA